MITYCAAVLTWRNKRIKCLCVCLCVPELSGGWKSSWKRISIFIVFVVVVSASVSHSGRHLRECDRFVDGRQVHKAMFHRGDKSRRQRTTQATCLHVNVEPALRVCRQLVEWPRNRRPHLTAIWRCVQCQMSSLDFAVEQWRIQRGAGGGHFPRIGSYFYFCKNSFFSV